MPRKKKLTTPPAGPEPEAGPVLTLSKADGETLEKALANVVVKGLCSNAATTAQFAKVRFTDIDSATCFDAIKEAAGCVNRGDMNDMEGLMVAQALSLNAIYSEYARRSANNLRVNPEISERYMRLALKAQGQCSATVERLMASKNPTIFARQANVAHGPQQVNNSIMTRPADVARAGDLESRRNELLEAQVERLDTGASGTAADRDSGMAPVGAIDRALDPGGQTAIVAKRRPRR
ncbi:MAG: hypothetical protein ABIW19_18335 [Vicinamibacterales bacterium]